jgi:hypothetical protein
MHRPGATPTIADSSSGRGGLQVRLYALVCLPSVLDLVDKFRKIAMPRVQIPAPGIVRLTSVEREAPSGIRDHAAATAFLH